MLFLHVTIIPRLKEAYSYERTFNCIRFRRHVIDGREKDFCADKGNFVEGKRSRSSGDDRDRTYVPCESALLSAAEFNYYERQFQRSPHPLPNKSADDH